MSFSCREIVTRTAAADISAPQQELNRMPHPGRLDRRNHQQNRQELKNGNMEIVEADAPVPQFHMTAFMDSP